MPPEGFEPSPSFEDNALNVARIPIPPRWLILIIMRIKLGKLRSMINEENEWRNLRRADTRSDVPPVGSWIMFNQHGRNRRAEPVRINAVEGDRVQVAWGTNDYTDWFSREEIEFRNDPTVMDDSDPRVAQSIEPSPRPTQRDVYGGDPDDRPWGLGT